MFESFTNWALHAYADGELEGREKQAVEELLQRDESARKMLATIQSQKRTLRAAYDGVLDEPVPPRLLAAAQGITRMQQLLRRGAAAAAVIAVLGIGGLAGASWFMNQGATDAGLAGQSLGAYRVYAAGQPTVEIPGTDKAHLQEWLSQRIGVKFNVPDLTERGYTLVGGRLLANGDVPAGLLIYQNGQHQSISVYFAANKLGNTLPMQAVAQGKFVTCTWVEPDLVYGVTGEQPVAAMMALANEAHEGFDQEG